MPSEKSRGMESLEALYRNIPEGFEEELTLANFAKASLNIKESAAKQNRKEKENLEVISTKSAEPLKIKNITRQCSSSPDSAAQSIDFGKGLQAVKPTSLEGQNIRNSTLSCHVKTPSDQSYSSSRYIIKGSGIKDQYASDVDDNISMVSDRSYTMGGSHRKAGNISTDFDLSYTSAYSVTQGTRNGADQDKSMQKCLGTPHTNICSICDKSAGWGKCRCLVCGRAYCKKCTTEGMGDMPEGRKCIACVGHRFSQRYIGEAGKIGCCLSVPGPVKLAELKWAELGPRKVRNRPIQTQTRTQSPSPSPSPRPSPSPSPRPRRLSPRTINRISPTRENRAHQIS